MIRIEVDWAERAVEEGSYISQRYRTPDAQRNKMRQAPEHETPVLDTTIGFQHPAGARASHPSAASFPTGPPEIWTASGGKDFSAGLARLQRWGKFVARGPAQFQSLSVTVAGKV